MNKLMIGIALLFSVSAIAGKSEIRTMSASAHAIAYQEKGIIVSVTGNAAKYMYVRGLKANGVYNTYSNDDDSYISETVKYAEFRCKKTARDIFSFIPGETVRYECDLGVSDNEI